MIFFLYFRINTWNNVVSILESMWLKYTYNYRSSIYNEYKIFKYPHNFTCNVSKCNDANSKICLSGGLDYPRSSVIGLFRRESTGSTLNVSSNDSSPQKERRGSASGSNAVLLIEQTIEDPLGATQKPSSAGQQIPTLMTTAAPQPQTPSQRRQARRGSMLELSGFVDDTGNTNTRWPTM